MTSTHDQAHERSGAVGLGLPETTTVPAGVHGPQRAIRHAAFQLPVQAPYLRIAPSP